MELIVFAGDVGLVPAPGPLGGFGTPAISAAPATALAISAADSTALATVPPPPPPTHLIPTTVVESSPGILSIATTFNQK